MAGNDINDLLVKSSLQSVPKVKTQQQVASNVTPAAKVVSSVNVKETSDANTVVREQAVELEKLREKVTELNSHMQTIDRNLHFSVDEQSGDTVVRVINAETEELVRQIPSEEVLQARNAINEFKGLLLETKT
ncbi:MAG: flagellar protein FlaG [Gammaproteobacteria bacterium]|nr:flagellar protein FlaG [Gammaproteobacteria bacterium]